MDAPAIQKSATRSAYRADSGWGGGTRFLVSVLIVVLGFAIGSRARTVFCRPRCAVTLPAVVRAWMLAHAPGVAIPLILFPFADGFIPFARRVFFHVACLARGQIGIPIRLFWGLFVRLHAPAAGGTRPVFCIPCVVRAGIFLFRFITAKTFVTSVIAPGTVRAFLLIPVKRGTALYPRTHRSVPSVVAPAQRAVMMPFTILRRIRLFARRGSLAAQTRPETATFRLRSFYFVSFIPNVTPFFLRLAHMRAFAAFLAQRSLLIPLPAEPVTADFLPAVATAAQTAFFKPPFPPFVHVPVAKAPVEPSFGVASAPAVTLTVVRAEPARFSSKTSAFIGMMMHPFPVTAAHSVTAFMAVVERKTIVAPVIAAVK